MMSTADMADITAFAARERSQGARSPATRNSSPQSRAAAG